MRSCSLQLEDVDPSTPVTPAKGHTPWIHRELIHTRVAWTMPVLLVVGCDVCKARPDFPCTDVMGLSDVPWRYAVHLGRLRGAMQAHLDKALEHDPMRQNMPIDGRSGGTYNPSKAQFYGDVVNLGKLDTGTD